MSDQGRIVWHDLNTTDLDGAKRFYSAMFGWRIEAGGGWNFLYPADSDQHFGTVMVLPPERGTPSHWVPYLEVVDLDAAVARVTRAGGTIFMGKTAAGKTGVFAVVADRAGAVFTLWQYTSEVKAHDEDAPPKLGSFCWDELLTHDASAAVAFYREVIGYEPEAVTIPNVEYTLLTRPDARRPDGKARQAAGVFRVGPEVPRSFWMSYVAVADCDEAFARAQALGATPTIQPQDIPSVGRFAAMLDPTKAPIAILARPK